MTHRAPDIEELRTFCAAAELGSLGRAAVRLGVSQPALSKRLSHLESATGVRLLDRSPHGVKLTPAGRPLYEEARRLLQQADLLASVMARVRHTGGPIRLAASHSAMEAFVGEVLGGRSREGEQAVELVLANSSVVRDLVADGRADLGAAACRPHRTPYPGVRELPIAQDEIVCAVPPGHPWNCRESVTESEFLTTPMVMRDPASNARWTVAAVLRERELGMPPILVEAGTPQAAMREARAHRAPLLLSRAVLQGHDFHELPIEHLTFPRTFVLVLPAQGEPSQHVTALMDELRRQADTCPDTRPGTTAGVEATVQGTRHASERSST